MRDTRKLNIVTVTEFNELVGVIGSNDRAMIIYLGENNKDNFPTWYNRIGSFYDPDIKLWLAHDHITNGLHVKHNIGNVQVSAENVHFAFRMIEAQLDGLEYLLNSKARNTPAGNSIAKTYVLDIRKIIDKVIGSS